MAKRVNRRRAEAAWQASKAACTSTLLSGGIAPTLLSFGLEAGRALGWRRVAMLVGVALLASGVAREWTTRGADRDDAPDAPAEP